MTNVDVRLLGDFSVVVDGAPLPPDAFTTRRAADLVKVLALAPTHRLPRDAVVETLWPHLSPEAGLANLHKAAHHARRALGFSGAIVVQGGAVALAPDATLTTDVERFETGDDSAYAGDLLPDDRYEEWTIHARDRLHGGRLELLRRNGDWAELVALDPADEQAHRELMREHAARGDLAAVVRQFAALRDELAHLGLAPTDETQAVYAELRDGPAVQPPLLHRAPLVGRDDELQAAMGALAAADAGHGGALLMLGDAGIGKTHLTDCLLNAAGRRGWHVLRATGREPDGRVPYRLIGEALEPLLSERADLAARLSEPVQASLGVLMGRGGSARGQDLLLAVSRLLATAARERGVLLALEDLHGADDATLRILRYLVPAARGERLLVVLTARPGEGGQAVARLRRELLEQRATTLALGPLAPEAIGAIATSDRALPRDAVEAIVARAAGNPFYAKELADAGAAARLQDLLDARLDTVEPELLAALAVVEEGCSTVEIEQLTGIPVGDGLERAELNGVLERVGGMWRFRHPLLREATRRRVPAAALRRAHAICAELLAGQGAAPECVAAHLLECGRERDAVPLLHRAAAAAADVGAYGDGRRWVEEALRHAETTDRPALLELLGDLRHGLGDARAPGTYREAAAVAPAERRGSLAMKEARALLAVGDLDGAEQAVSIAGTDPAATCIRGLVAWYRGDVATARAYAAAAAERAPAAVEVYTLQALVAHADGHWERSMELRLAEVWNAPEMLDQVLDAYMCVTEYLLHAGDHSSRLIAFAGELHERAKAAGARRGVAFSAIVLGEARLLAGEPEAAPPLLREAVHNTRGVGCYGGESVARMRLGEALAVLGDQAGAQAQLEEAAELAHASSLSAHLLFLAHAALVRWARDPQEALSRVDRAEAILDPSPPCRFCPVEFFTAAAIACARAGELERAQGYLDRAQASVAGWSSAPRAAAVAEARAELLLAEGRHEDAEVAFLRAAEGYEAIGHRLAEERVRRAVPAAVA